MIDVVFLLVVFFILVSQVVSREAEPLDLPKVTTKLPCDLSSSANNFILLLLTFNTAVLSLVRSCLNNNALASK